MKKSWYCHDPMTTTEAEQLIQRYTSRNVKTEKTLSADPRLWIVAALLPFSDREPRTDRRYQQRIFQ